MKRVKEACSEDADTFCSVEGTDMSIYACMFQHQDQVNDECMEIVQSDPMINARFHCAAEIIDACPVVGMDFRGDDYEDSEEDYSRCLHEYYTNGFTEECSTAFDAAWVKFKEDKNLEEEDTPMDTDVADILVQHSRFVNDEPIIDGWEWEDDMMYTNWHVISAISASVFCVLAALSLCCVFACVKSRNRRAVNLVRYAPQSVQQQPAQQQSYASLPSSAPPAYPIALPYNQRTVQSTAQPTVQPFIAVPVQPRATTTRSGYPGLR